MSQENILDYLRKTPHNTNVNVVKGMIGGVGGSLPEVTEADNGKVLTVIDGQWGKAEGGSGGDVGYECTESWVTLTEESVTTEQHDSVAGGQLAYSQPIDADIIKVTFNGAEYECQKHSMGMGAVYGADDGSGDEPDFTKYPFIIFSPEFITETAGTYTVKIEAYVKTITTTPCFDEVINSFSNVKHLIPGETTRREIEEAKNEGKLMYCIDGNGDYHIIMRPIMNNPLSFSVFPVDDGFFYGLDDTLQHFAIGINES